MLQLEGMYKIIHAPDKGLSRPTKPVDFSGIKLLEIISGMRETLVRQHDPEGVGLAANQVGLPYRLFLTRFTNKKSEPIRAFVNPEVVTHNEQLQPKEEKKSPLEGCLSVPKYYGVVRRWQEVTLHYFEPDKAGKLLEKTETFTDFPAIVIQHEMDHLTGHIFVQRILEQRGKLYKITGRDQTGREIWSKVEFS